MRFILGAIKTNTDIERLADQAINILKKGERLLKATPARPYTIIPEMAQLARQMVKESLHAYVNRNAEQARSVLLKDDQLDEMKKRMTTEMQAIMEREPGKIPQAMDMLLIARNLERIGDHATNIAESAIFIAEGKDVRHNL